jgi:hypothetical protein
LTAENKNSLHNQRASFWAAALFLFNLTGVSTTWIDWGPFWNGYVLDITGPAWTYILFRGLFTEEHDNRWTRSFTPVRTFVLFITASFGIETMQYFKIYPSTFDPWDFVAYASLLTPLFLLDYRQSLQISEHKKRR